MVAAVGDGIVPSQIGDVSGGMQRHVQVSVSCTPEYFAELFVHLDQQFGSLGDVGPCTDFYVGRGLLAPDFLLSLNFFLVGRLAEVRKGYQVGCGGRGG